MYYYAENCGGIARKTHATIFSIDATGLYCDTMHRKNFIPENFRALRFTYQLPASRFIDVMNLPKEIPDEIREKTEGSFGVTHSDGGLIHVWTYVNNNHCHWTFGADQTKSSPAVQAYYEKLVRIFNR
jgi:hypothetical protein